MSVYEITEGRDFDCVAAQIHCRADRDGARVIEIASGNVVVQVLAHDEQAAREAAEGCAAQWLDGTP